MRELLLFQVTMLLGVSLALDLRHSGPQVPTTNELQRYKPLASSTNLKANPFLQDDEDLRLSDQTPSTLTSLLLSQETPSSAGNLQLKTRSRRDAVDRVLSIFGGSMFAVSRPRHTRPNEWRPVHPRPHLGRLKHHGPPPHHKGPHHVRGPHHHKYRGPPKHHSEGHHKHNDDHHIIHDDDDHHHHFEEHHGDDIHHDEGPIHHDDSHIHHDDGPIHYDSGNVHHDGPIHHDSGPAHHDSGPAHHDSGPAHHDGSDAHYDDQSINDIHDYPDHEYIVEYDDGGLVFGHHDTSFKPSFPDQKRPHHKPNYHHDPHHDSHFDHDSDDDHHLSNNPGHIASITKNNIYRDDVPFKEVVNDNDKIHDGLEPGGVKGLDPDLISFISDKSRPYLIGGHF